MAKGKSRGSIVGTVGGVLIGAAILLFVCTLILNNLKTANADQDDSEDFNTTVAQIQTMLTVSAILLSVMGIVIIGAQIIGYIGGGFGA